MAVKLFIVERGNEAVFRALNKALENEPDVTVIYDRRVANQGSRPAQERRVDSDVDQRIRTIGFAVVRPSSFDVSTGNIRWS